MRYSRLYNKNKREVVKVLYRPNFVLFRQGSSEYKVPTQDVEKMVERYRQKGYLPIDLNTRI
jgi:hypothetical protein